MSTQLIDRIVADEQTIGDLSSNSFTPTYFEFLRYFSDLTQITPHHVVISAHFTYGWMPRMLSLKSTNFDDAATILNDVKQSIPITDEQLSQLIRLINNSIVGVSKLLHFVNPNQYAIWDSRVAGYLYHKLPYAQLRRPETYRTYLQTCYDLIQEEAFKSVHKSINKKMGQDVSALRAVELVMFNGRSKPGENTQLKTRFS